MRIVCLILYVVAVLVSCKKEGCTDEYALNFSADAEKDDGSCYSWSECRIKSIELAIISDTNDNGDEWDDDGLPDCFIDINYFGNSTILQTGVINEVAIGKTVVYNLNPAIVVYNSSQPSYWFSVYDKDSTSSLLMGDAIFNLPSIPFYGSSLNASYSFQKRIKLMNTLNNKLMSVTLVVDWI